MPPLRAGQLRTPLTVQQKVETPDGQGGSTFAWDTVATPVWAKWVPAAATGDTNEADQTVSRRQYTATIRRRSDITAAMRVNTSGVTYDITAVLPSDDYPDALVLQCREVPA
ncbi:MAG TPA: phage head closure protein [Gemmatimonadaceae bacterium]|nr:phage head closure protein [Gemmatimonadaceae bacterium]